MIKLEFYLDNAATTPMLPEVLAVAQPFLDASFGNPSSLHALGMEARRAINQAREELSRVLGVPPRTITFTSGGTESDNLALRGVFASDQLKGDRLLVSAIEHPAVLETARSLAREGVQVETIPITTAGVVDLPRLETMLNPDVRMVSCMAVNNEMGTRQPLLEIGAMLRAKAPRAIFHVDAVQAFTKGALPWREAGVHLLSLSGHKIHAPKGVGALVQCQPVSLAPGLVGGGQESGLRSGTENPFAIVGFAQAARLVSQKHLDQRQMRLIYHRQWLDFLAEFPRIKVFRSEHETPFVISFRLEPIPGEVILHHLEQAGLLVSTGSACHTRKPEPSPVLLAAGLNAQEALSTVRLSFSLHNTMEGLPMAQQAFRQAMVKLDKL